MQPVQQADVSSHSSPGSTMPLPHVAAVTQTLEERNAATSPVPKEVAVEKELTAVLARPMLNL